MRRDTRNHQAASIKEINQSTFKKDEDKTWVQCELCDDWLYEETYFKAEWHTGPSVFSPFSFGHGYGESTHRICNACCHTTLDVVDYLVELTNENKVEFDKSYAVYLKAEKKKEKEALTIVDGKKYSFTFKESK